MRRIRAAGNARHSIVVISSGTDWGNSEKETGQTVATMAISTMMAFEHNYKILTISTGFKDRTMDESFWPANRATGLQRILGTQSECFINKC